MCGLFVHQDPASYAAETRPIRLHGHATSIRLEVAFWGILEEIAAKERLSLGRFVCVLHDEIVRSRGSVPNLASFLRVTCLHYLRNQELHAQQVAERLARTAVSQESDAAIA